jgi:hypothetical protein
LNSCARNFQLAAHLLPGMHKNGQGDKLYGTQRHSRRPIICSLCCPRFVETF